MKDLTKEELLSLLKAYDEYVQDANDGDLYENGWKPVCIEEFYYNDYEDWSE